MGDGAARKERSRAGRVGSLPKRIGSVSMLAMLSALAAGQARAQQATNAASTVQLDTIDVAGRPVQSATGPIDGYIATQSAAGTKTSTPLIETPQAIQVVGAKQIQDQQARTVTQALSYSPGVLASTFGADFRNDWFLIRGFNEQNTGYYLDGLQLYSSNFATFKLEPWNLERIDVIRGPSATLYGGGDPGGLINAVSKMPLFTNFGQVELGVNEYGNAFGAADIGGVAGAHNEWSYRFVTLGQIGGTQVDFTNSDRAFVAPSLSYKPDAATTFTLLGQYQHDSTKGLNFLPYEGTVTPAPYGRIPTHFFSSDPSIDKFTRDQSMIGYRFEEIVNPNITVRQNVRYSHLDVNEQTLYGAGYADAPTNTVLARNNFLERPSADLVTVDNQGEFRFNTFGIPQIALLGVDYKHYNVRDYGNFDYGPFNPQYNLNLLYPVYTQQPLATGVFSRYTNSQDQIGTYAQDQLKFGRLNVVLGARHDFTDTDQLNRASGVKLNSSPDAWSGKVGAIYQLDYGFAPYVSYSTSFNPLVGVNFSSGLPYVPEYGEQEEVGVKYQSPDLPITAGLALFNIDRTNVLTTDPNFVLGSIQTGAQRSRGIEADVQAQLTDGLSILAAYTAYELEVTKDLDPTLIGKVPTGTPQQFGSLWLDYTVPVGAYAGLGVSAGVRYYGQSFADPQNQLRVPDAVVGDAAIHYDHDHWRAALNVNNFTDEKYVKACSGSTSCYYADRRVTTVSLAYRW